MFEVTYCKLRATHRCGWLVARTTDREFVVVAQYDQEIFADLLLETLNANIDHEVI